MCFNFVLVHRLCTRNHKLRSSLMAGWTEVRARAQRALSNHAAERVDGGAVGKFVWCTKSCLGVIVTFYETYTPVNGPGRET